MATAIKVHALPFHDHVGSASVMVFWAPIDQPLPPLYNFTIYVTSPDITSPESLGAAELLRALIMSRYAPETTSYRLDIYFRPGASNGKSKRGTDDNQGTRQCLPGLVPSYLRPPSFCHHDMLFIVDSPAGWQHGAEVRMVEFRPAEVPEEFEPDPEDLEEAPEIIAPTRVRDFPVCPDPETYDGAGTVQGGMYQAFLIKEEQLSGPYERALELGWTSW